MVKSRQRIFLDRYGRDPIGFMVDCLDVRREFVWSKMEEVSLSVRDEQKTCVYAGHGVSKAVSIDTFILTTSGFKLMGDVKVGDFVYDEGGIPTEVLSISDILEEKAYRVIFDDNSEIVAHGGHLWSVLDFLARKRLLRKGVRDFRDCWKNTKTLTTLELIKNLKHNKQTNYSIPISRVIQDKKSGNEIDFPYTLGFWLGDGTRGDSGVCIGNKDVGVISEIETEGFEVVNRPSQIRNGCSSYCVRGLITKLKKLGLSVDKHIPDSFLRLSYTTRLAILQGFMDADGFKLAHGHSAACGLTDKRLYDSLIPFIVSLGVKVFTSTKVMNYKGNPKLVYKFNFSSGFQPFRLKRKFINTSKNQISRRTQRFIIDIVDNGVKKVKCISVGTENSLYLCGKNLVPTHNSFTAARLVLWFLYTHKPSTVITTAPIFDLVEKVLWKEIHSAYSNAKIPLGGNMTKTQLDIDPDRKWFAYGFSAKPDTVTNEATSVQGKHNDYVLVVLDEAAGIMSQIWKAVESLLMDKNCKILAIGNPTSSQGSFVDCGNDPTWHCINISVKDTPNFKAGRTVIPGVSGIEYEEMIRVKYGEESNEYKIRVLGRRPEHTLGTYLGRGLAKAVLEGRTGLLNLYECVSPVYTFSDFGRQYSAIWFVQFIKEQIRLVDFYYDCEGRGFPAYAEMFREKRYTYGGHYSLPDIFKQGSNQKAGMTGQYTVDIARSLGLDFEKIELPSRDDCIRCAQDIMDRCWFSSIAQEGVEGLKDWRSRKNEKESTTDKPVYFKEAVLSWGRHCGDSFCGIAVAYRNMSFGGQRIGSILPIFTEYTKPRLVNSVYCGFRRIG